MLRNKYIRSVHLLKEGGIYTFALALLKNNAMEMVADVCFGRDTKESFKRTLTHQHKQKSSVASFYVCHVSIVSVVKNK